MLTFHMCPGVFIYMIYLYIIDYGTEKALNKPTDVFG